jgi:preprotein translocase subunit YajC
VGSLIVIVLLLVLAWFFFVMPARRRQQRHRAMQDDIEIGDEIITAGGIHGTVHELGDEDLRLEIAPGVIVTLDRRAVAAVARDVEELEPEEPEDLKDELENAEKTGGSEP